MGRQQDPSGNVLTDATDKKDPSHLLCHIVVCFNLLLDSTRFPMLSESGRAGISDEGMSAFEEAG